jgi:hypothetical protein
LRSKQFNTALSGLQNKTHSDRDFASDLLIPGFAMLGA